MKIGVVYPQTELGGDPGAIRAVGRMTEERGFDYLLCYDHLLGAVHDDRDPPLWGPYTENDPFHDPFVLFAFLAGVTERIGFATGVLILPQRQTVLVARQAADLDLLSGERLRLGVGVGWNSVEYSALGQDFTTRGRRANEQIEHLRSLWSGEILDWRGEFDLVDRARLIPSPRRQIPIWVGGFGDAAFRRGVAHGDGFMFAGDDDRVFAALERLRELAADAGRDLTDFGLEYVAVRAGSPSEAAESAGRWRDAGGTHFAAASMWQGIEGIDDHLAFFDRIADQLTGR